MVSGRLQGYNVHNNIFALVLYGLSETWSVTLMEVLCEEREKTNKMQQSDVYCQHCVMEVRRLTVFENEKLTRVFGHKRKAAIGV